VLGYIAVNTWIEIKYREIAYTILLAVFTGIFLFYAIFWNALAKREKVEQKERLDDADLTRQRLSKRKDQTRD
jgi:cbb3-type cytochrome oxidase subunit 3